MRHVRYDNGFFQFSPEPFPAFRPSAPPQGAVRTPPNLPVVGGVRPGDDGILAPGAFQVVRPRYGDPAVASLGPQETEQPGVLVFGLVTDGAAPQMAEGMATLLVDLPVVAPQGVGRAFCAVMRGEERVVMRTVGPEGPKDAHVFKPDGSYTVCRWEDYREEWKLRRLARLCSD